MFADKIDLILEYLWAEAANFAEIESKYDEPALYGVTDNKAVGTYLKHKFTSHLMERYRFGAGNSANGIDLPSLNVDIKVTSIRQPQSYCPYKLSRRVRRSMVSATTSLCLSMKKWAIRSPVRAG